MEIVYFTIIAIVLYFLSDWLLDRLERFRGSRFENRNLIFFFILLVLALTSFTLVNHLVA